MSGSKPVTRTTASTRPTGTVASNTDVYVAAVGPTYTRATLEAAKLEARGRHTTVMAVAAAACRYGPWSRYRLLSGGGGKAGRGDADGVYGGMGAKLRPG